MKIILSVLLVTLSLFAQETLCEKGNVNLLISSGQNEECYKQLMIKKSYKYRLCDSGVGFLYNEGQTNPLRLFFDQNKWSWRVDSLDFSKQVSTTTKLTIDSKLTVIQYDFLEKTYKGEELRKYTCHGEFQKN